MLVCSVVASADLLDRLFCFVRVIIEAAISELDHSGSQRSAEALSARTKRARVLAIERIQLGRARARADRLPVVVAAVFCHGQELGSSGFHLCGGEQRGGRGQARVRIVLAIALDTLLQPPVAVNLAQLGRIQAAQTMQIVAVLRDHKLQLAALLELETDTTADRQSKREKR